MPEPQTSSSSKVRHSLLHSETLSRVLGEDAMRVLRCGICTNFFEVPIVLPCGHTFCLQCLTKMCTQASINHAPKTSQDVRIGCPNCHVLIYATPILRRNVTCNFIVQSLIECLGVREDKGIFRTANTHGCGGDYKASSSSASSAPPTTTTGFDDHDHHHHNNNEDVNKMLSDLDRVTMTLARSNVVDRAFMEIEDIRREHLARERQRQAERDAKTRDQVRAVQSIMKQSREEEQQQQQQRKHQHHHFQQQQQQQQLQQQQQQQQQQLQQQQHQQLQQRQILTRPHQSLDAKPQQPQSQQLLLQQSTATTPTNLQSQPLNMFLWKCPLLTPMSNTDVSLAPATPTKPPPPPPPSAPCCSAQTTASSKQQPHPNQPTASQQPQQQSQRYSPHIFQHMGRDDPFNSPQQTNKDPHSPQQPPAQPPPPPPPQPYQHSVRKVIPSLKQTTGAIATASPNQTPQPTAINTPQTGIQVTPDKQRTANMATVQLRPENHSAKSSPLGNENLQALNFNQATSDLQCVQLNNDPAVMSFSLMTAMTSASSK